MKLYAGVDVGMLNLAICIIDSDKWKKFQQGDPDPGIVLWRNINLLQDTEPCCATVKSGVKRGQACGKKASSRGSNGYYCGRHATATCTKYKSEELKKLSIITLEKRVVQLLDSIPELKSVKVVAIETQPRVNQKMKMFGSAVQMYFVIRCIVDIDTPALTSIRASPAKNKLTMYTGPPISTAHIKNPYDRRKYLAVKHTEYILRGAPETLKLHFFPYKKRDDLADAFLHCLYAIGVRGA